MAPVSKWDSSPQLQVDDHPTYPALWNWAQLLFVKLHQSHEFLISPIKSPWNRMEIPIKIPTPPVNPHEITWKSPENLVKSWDFPHGNPWKIRHSVGPKRLPQRFDLHCTHTRGDLHGRGQRAGWNLKLRWEGNDFSGHDGNHWKTIGKPLENHWKTIGKPLENHGKTMGKPWENRDFTGENGDSTGENCDFTRENDDFYQGTWWFNGELRGSRDFHGWFGMSVVIFQQKYVVFWSLNLETYTIMHTCIHIDTDMAVCQNLVPLVNIKIAGKWMFIPLKMVLIGIDPYPYRHSATSKRKGRLKLEDIVISA